MTILVAISDVMFLSKVDVTASHVGASVVKAARNVPLVDEIVRVKPSRVLLDLASPAFGGVESVRAIRAVSDVTIVGYCRHTSEELIAAGLDAGCSEVLTQGQFSSRLDQLLRE